MKEGLRHCDGSIHKTIGDDLDMIENLDLALRIKTQLEDYLTQLGYKEALVTIDDITIKASRKRFEKHELHYDNHQFSILHGYYIYDEDLIVKQLSDYIIGKLVGILEPLSVDRELSRFEVNIRYSSVDALKAKFLTDTGEGFDIVEAVVYYKIKPFHK